jgi:hypothetical protein
MSTRNATITTVSPGDREGDFISIEGVSKVHEARTHLSLQKDAPIPRGVQTIGQMFAVPILGGLHHQDIRA